MNNNNFKLFLYFVIGVTSAFLTMYFFNNYKIEKKDSTEISSTQNSNNPKENRNENQPVNYGSSNANSSDIDDLTEESKVIDFVKSHKKLPDYYLTKSQARKSGWIPSKGNLCEVLPGKAIGGDKFSNREKSLPGGNQYYEADVNYQCGTRNADRIVFTKSGEVWLTKNHYKSFQKQ